MAEKDELEPDEAVKASISMPLSVYNGMIRIMRARGIRKKSHYIQQLIEEDMATHGKLIAYKPGEEGRKAADPPAVPKHGPPRRAEKK